jgi:Cu-processing system permease protein
MSQLSNTRVGATLMLRARFGLIAFWLVVILCLTAWMGAQFSGRQPATVALDLGLSLMRITLPVLGVLMLQELFSREFERRYFLGSLTYPRQRHHFLLGRLGALMGLLAVLLVVLASALAAIVVWIGQGYGQSTPVSLGVPYWLSIAFILLDLFLVLAFGTLLAVVASTPSFVIIGTLGFMLIARSFSSIVALLQQDSSLVGGIESYDNALGLLGYLLPDLAALDVREIALYGRMELLPADWLLLVVSSLAYAVAFLALAVWALNRKRFA